MEKKTLRALFAVCATLLVVTSASAADPLDSLIQTAAVGDHALRVLTPTVLELYLVNTKQPDPGRVDRWDWVNDQQKFASPDLSSLKVLVNGQTDPLSKIGFKRRPVYAPLLYWDLRIANELYLQLANPIPVGASVLVVNNGTLWPTNMDFSAVADPVRLSPAIHVNQEGYLPEYPKQGTVGYYLGDMGELAIPTNKFFVVSASSSAVAFEGTLTLRQDVGYNYTPTPYQNVYEADFTPLTTPGEYRLMVPGMGVSLPFKINEGIAMDFARTYALGMFHQRSGFAVGLPFTRFTHAIDHTAPAAVPTNAAGSFAFTWQTVANYSSEVNPDNPVQTAPALTNYNAQLFPFVNQGTVSVPGGHFEAGDYNRVTYNGAQLVHTLVFAADSLPGVGALDNLGIPESADGISDALQEAKWEADFIARMQDADGGFYYSVYPRDREYELDVLPENGDPQVVWPKNTATTASAVAALVQCSSSPRFKQAYPQAASDYWAKAMLGWRFLTNAIARLGFDGAYQKVQHFDDYFTHRDDLAWAACELYLATGDTNFQASLFEWFPDPTDTSTFQFGWRRMSASYGNAVRDYAFAVKSGRLSAAQIQQDYLAKCITVITNCGEDLLQWSESNAYGTSFPAISKAYRGGGWYFSGSQAFDLVVAHQFDSDPRYVEALLHNVNYEAGCNPVNVCYLTGIGWKRLHNVVDQYSLNDRRSLPKDGVPVSNIQTGFMPVWVYGWELNGLTYPADSADTAPYAYYDRWSDDWNVSTEGSTTDMGRGFAATAWLAAQTSLASQAWRSAAASISAPSTPRQIGQPVPLTLSVSGPDLSQARIIWEAEGQEPVFGGATYTFNPGNAPGSYWVEAEAQWPDGRRVFATNSVTFSADALPELRALGKAGAAGFSFSLAGKAQETYVIQVSNDLVNWNPLATNTLPLAGTLTITDPDAGSSARKYYRAMKVQ